MSNLTSKLEVKNITKYFHGLAGSKICALENVSLEINSSDSKGSINSILSKPGAGKTVLLKIISAIEKPTSGEIFIEGEKYSRPDGRIVFIPESPSSFPWMNVKENISFGFKSKKNNFDDTGEKLEKLISLAGLEGYENYHPQEKNSGFRFRISLARALAAEPKIILIDNSLRTFSNETKKELYELLRSVKLKMDVGFILATTNINETIELSDKIFLMQKNHGKIFRQIIVEEFKKDHLSEDENYTLRMEIEKAFNLHEEFHDIS